MRRQLQYVIFCSFLFIFYKFVCSSFYMREKEKDHNLLDPGLLAVFLRIFTKFLYKNYISHAPF